MKCVENLAPSTKQFFDIVHENYASLQKQDLNPKDLVLDQPFHVPLKSLTPGQNEISADNVLAKLKSMKEKWNLRWEDKTKAWKLNHNSGKSLLPRKEALVVALGPDNILVIVDGHHHAFMSLYVGAETVPAVIIEKWDKLKPVEFWTKLKQEGHIFFPETPAQLTARPPDFTKMKDNPNRYFASLLASRAELRYENGKITVKNVRGNGNGCWIKLNEGVPFLEFHIAEILKDAGLHYDSKWGNDVPKEMAEKARTALVNAKRNGDHWVLNNIILLEDRNTAKAIQDSSDRLIGIIQGVLQQNKMEYETLNSNFSAAWSKAHT